MGARLYRRAQNKLLAVVESSPDAADQLGVAEALGGGLGPISTGCLQLIECFEELGKLEADLVPIRLFLLGSSGIVYVLPGELLLLMLLLLL